MNILIVEDDSAAALLLQQGLAGLGYGSEIARDGELGLEMARAGNFDLWVVDVMMPRMDGLATLQRIMKDSPTRVIMLSAMDKKDDLLPIKALEMGAVAARDGG